LFYIKKKPGAKKSASGSGFVLSLRRQSAWAESLQRRATSFLAPCFSRLQYTSNQSRVQLSKELVSKPLAELEKNKNNIDWRKSQEIILIFSEH
jgi:hypothetical protein